MNTKKIALAVVTLFVAVGGAFATQNAVTELGHTKYGEGFPGQTEAEPCKPIIECDLVNTFPCKVRVAGVDYNLYLLQGTSCPIQLRDSRPFIQQPE